MFFKKLDFPPIPKDIIDALESNLTNTVVVHDIGYKRTYTKDNKNLNACAYSMSNVVYANLNKWLEENVPGVDSRFNILFQTQSSKNNLSSTHIVHTDRVRLTALNYIIEEGGDNVLTSWFKEDNKNLVREKKESGTQSDSGLVNYEDLNLLQSTRLEKENWYIINTRILHDVDNIIGTRKSLSISFHHRDYLEK